MWELLSFSVQKAVDAVNSDAVICDHIEHGAAESAAVVHNIFPRNVAATSFIRVHYFFHGDTLRFTFRYNEYDLYWMLK